MKKSKIKALLLELAKDYGIDPKDIEINRKTVDFKPSIKDAALYFGSKLPNDFHKTDKKHILFCTQSYRTSSDDKGKKGKYYSGTLKADPSYFTIVCSYAELYDYIYSIDNSFPNKLQTPQPATKTWQPKRGNYFIINGTNVIDDSTPYYSDSGLARDSAEAAHKDLPTILAHNRLLAYVAEFDPEFKEDFTKKSHNWSVHKNIKTGLWAESCFEIVKHPGAVFMSRQVAIDLANKLNSGEVVL